MEIFFPYPWMALIEMAPGSQPKTDPKFQVTKFEHLRKTQQPPDPKHIIKIAIPQFHPHSKIFWKKFSKNYVENPKNPKLSRADTKKDNNKTSTMESHMVASLVTTGECLSRHDEDD